MLWLPGSSWARCPCRACFFASRPRSCFFAPRARRIRSSRSSSSSPRLRDRGRAAALHPRARWHRPRTRCVPSLCAASSPPDLLRACHPSIAAGPDRRAAVRRDRRDQHRPDTQIRSRSLSCWPSRRSCSFCSGSPWVVERAPASVASAACPSSRSSTSLSWDTRPAGSTGGLSPAQNARARRLARWINRHGRASTKLSVTLPDQRAASTRSTGPNEAVAREALRTGSCRSREADALLG